MSYEVQINEWRKEVEIRRLDKQIQNCEINKIVLRVQLGRYTNLEGKTRNSFWRNFSELGIGITRLAKNHRSDS